MGMEAFTPKFAILSLWDVEYYVLEWGTEQGCSGTQ